MSKIIRWGILGTGLIAREFAQGLRSVADTQLLAIGSRTLATAQECAHQLGVPRSYGSYEDLLKDADVDIVYVATPHSRHKQDCILCLEAGKAVLCEKPFTINAQEAREVITLARQKQLFCMEAMWMRFLPLIQKVKEMINSGVIGEVRMINADFGYKSAYNPESRFFNLQLGGGALLDRGIYPLSLAYHILSEPTDIVSQAGIGETGVDEQAAIILSYPQGQLAVLSTTLRGESSNQATIIGTRGKITIYPPFYRPHKISVKQLPEINAPATDYKSPGLKQKVISSIKQNPTLKRLYLQVDSLFPLFNNSGKTIFTPYDGNGYNYEAAEVVRCLQNGESESKIMPLDETLKIIETMDAIRSQWNLKYPQD